MQRPTSLTIIGWYLIVMAVLGALGLLLMRNNEMVVATMQQSSVSPSVQLAFGAVGCLVSAACGYGILKGLGWSRLAYVGWIVISIVFSLASAPFSSLMVVGWVIQALIIFFLFRPAANAWFGGSAAVNG